MKLTNLTITPKLGILLGVTLFGLCIAGALAGYLMQREMLAARIDQAHAIVDMARNMAAGLQKEVEAGKLTKEAALAEFGRRANAMTYDKGAGYLFGTSYDGITVLSPDPKQIGTNRMEVVTNGRKLSHELMDGVKANGEILLTYEYVKPGEAKPIRKIGYAVNVPGFNMYLGTGAYLDDLDAKLKPIEWLLGLAILGIAIISGSIAWLIGRSISIPLGRLGAWGGSGDFIEHRIVVRGRFFSAREGGVRDQLLQGLISASRSRSRGGIDEDRALLHLAEMGFAQHVVDLGPRRRVHRHEIGLRQHFRQGCRKHP